MLKPGDQAPNFSLRSHAGQDWDLKNALEKGPVVVFFYPKDDTPVCIVEACSFRDRHTDFVGKGAQVVGISRDSLESHASFAGKYELPYTLLSDPDGKVRELFGVKKTLGFFDGRVTFVVDQNSVVRHSFSSQLNAKAHVDEALRILNQLTPARG
jgi:peroxiredoxin Q/BCP